MAPKSLRFHTTKKGNRYDLQFDPDGKFAQAVLVHAGAGPGNLVLAFKAKSEEEALEMLLKELDKGPY